MDSLVCSGKVPLLFVTGKIADTFLDSSFAVQKHGNVEIIHFPDEAIEGWVQDSRYATLGVFSVVKGGLGTELADALATVIWNVNETEPQPWDLERSLIVFVVLLGHDKPEYSGAELHSEALAPFVKGLAGYFPRMGMVYCGPEPEIPRGFLSKQHPVPLPEFACTDFWTFFKLENHAKFLLEHGQEALSIFSPGSVRFEFRASEMRMFFQTNILPYVDWFFTFPPSSEIGLMKIHCYQEIVKFLLVKFLLNRAVRFDGLQALDSGSLGAEERIQGMTNAGLGPRPVSMYSGLNHQQMPDQYACWFISFLQETIFACTEAGHSAMNELAGIAVLSLEEPGGLWRSLESKKARRRAKIFGFLSEPDIWIPSIPYSIYVLVQYLKSSRLKEVLRGTLTRWLSLLATGRIVDNGTDLSDMVKMAWEGSLKLTMDKLDASTQHSVHQPDRFGQTILPSTDVANQLIAVLQEALSSDEESRSTPGGVTYFGSSTDEDLSRLEGPPSDPNVVVDAEEVEPEEQVIDDQEAADGVGTDVPAETNEERAIAIQALPPTIEQLSYTSRPLAELVNAPLYIPDQHRRNLCRFARENGVLGCFFEMYRESPEGKKDMEMRKLVSRGKKGIKKYDDSDKFPVPLRVLIMSSMQLRNADGLQVQAPELPAPLADGDDERETLCIWQVSAQEANDMERAHRMGQTEDSGRCVRQLFRIDVPGCTIEEDSALLLGAIVETGRTGSALRVTTRMVVDFDEKWGNHRRRMKRIGRIAARDYKYEWYNVPDAEWDENAAVVHTFDEEFDSPLEHDVQPEAPRRPEDGVYTHVLHEAAVYADPAAHHGCMAGMGHMYCNPMGQPSAAFYQLPPWERSAACCTGSPPQENGLPPMAPADMSGPFGLMAPNFAAMASAEAQRTGHPSHGMSPPSPPAPIPTTMVPATPVGPAAMGMGMPKDSAFRHPIRQCAAYSFRPMPNRYMAPGRSPFPTGHPRFFMGNSFPGQNFGPNHFHQNVPPGGPHMYGGPRRHRFPLASHQRLPQQPLMGPFPRLYMPAGMEPSALIPPTPSSSLPLTSTCLGMSPQEFPKAMKVSGASLPRQKVEPAESTSQDVARRNVTGRGLEQNGCERPAPDPGTADPRSGDLPPSPPTAGSQTGRFRTSFGGYMAAQNGQDPAGLERPYGTNEPAKSSFGGAGDSGRDENVRVPGPLQRGQAMACGDGHPRSRLQGGKSSLSDDSVQIASNECKTGPENRCIGQERIRILKRSSTDDEREVAEVRALFGRRASNEMKPAVTEVVHVEPPVHVVEKTMPKKAETIQGPLEGYIATETLEAIDTWRAFRQNESARRVAPQVQLRSRQQVQRQGQHPQRHQQQAQPQHQAIPPRHQAVQPRQQVIPSQHRPVPPQRQPQTVPAPPPEVRAPAVPAPPIPSFDAEEEFPSLPSQQIHQERAEKKGPKRRPAKPTFADAVAKGRVYHQRVALAVHCPPNKPLHLDVGKPKKRGSRDEVLLSALGGGNDCANSEHSSAESSRELPEQQDGVVANPRGKPDGGSDCPSPPVAVGKTKSKTKKAAKKASKVANMTTADRSVEQGAGLPPSAQKWMAYSQEQQESAAEGAGDGAKTNDNKEKSPWLAAATSGVKNFGKTITAKYVKKQQQPVVLKKEATSPGQQAAAVRMDPPQIALKKIFQRPGAQDGPPTISKKARKAMKKLAAKAVKQDKKLEKASLRQMASKSLPDPPPAEADLPDDEPALVTHVDENTLPEKPEETEGENPAAKAEEEAEEDNSLSEDIEIPCSSQQDGSKYAGMDPPGHFPGGMGSVSNENTHDVAGVTHVESGTPVVETSSGGSGTTGMTTFEPALDVLEASRSSSPNDHPEVGPASINETETIAKNSPRLSPDDMDAVSKVDTYDDVTHVERGAVVVKISSSGFEEVPNTTPEPAVDVFEASESSSNDHPEVGPEPNNGAETIAMNSPRLFPDGMNAVSKVDTHDVAGVTDVEPEALVASDNLTPEPALDVFEASRSSTNDRYEDGPASNIEAETIAKNSQELISDGMGSVSNENTHDVAGVTHVEPEALVESDNPTPEPVLDVSEASRSSTNDLYEVGAASNNDLETSSKNPQGGFPGGRDSFPEEETSNVAEGTQVESEASGGIPASTGVSDMTERMAWIQAYKDLRASWLTNQIRRQDKSLLNIAPKLVAGAPQDPSSVGKAPFSKENVHDVDGGSQVGQVASQMTQRWSGFAAMDRLSAQRSAARGYRGSPPSNADRPQDPPTPDKEQTSSKDPERHPAVVGRNSVLKENNHSDAELPQAERGLPLVNVNSVGSAPAGKTSDAGRPQVRPNRDEDVQEAIGTLSEELLRTEQRHNNDSFLNHSFLPAATVSGNIHPSLAHEDDSWAEEASNIRPYPTYSNSPDSSKEGNEVAGNGLRGAVAKQKEPEGNKQTRETFYPGATGVQRLPPGYGELRRSPRPLPRTVLERVIAEGNPSSVMTMSGAELEAITRVRREAASAGIPVPSMEEILEQLRRMPKPTPLPPIGTPAKKSTSGPTPQLGSEDERRQQSSEPVELYTAPVNGHGLSNATSPTSGDNTNRGQPNMSGLANEQRIRGGREASVMDPTPERSRVRPIMEFDGRVKGNSQRQQGQRNQTTFPMAQARGQPSFPISTPAGFVSNTPNEMMNNGSAQTSGMRAVTSVGNTCSGTGEAQTAPARGDNTIPPGFRNSATPRRTTESQPPDVSSPAQAEILSTVEAIKQQMETLHRPLEVWARGFNYPSNPRRTNYVNLPGNVDARELMTPAEKMALIVDICQNMLPQELTCCLWCGRVLFEQHFTVHRADYCREDGN